MCVIVNMLCAVRWPAVTNMELMLWTQIVVYFDNTFTFTRLRVCLTRMPPRHRPQLRHGSRRHRHRPRLRPLLRRRLFHNIPCHKNCRICCLAEMWLYKLRMVAGLCWRSAVQGKLPFCDCKYVVCSAVIGSHQDKAHAAEHKLYFYNQYRVSHNTWLTFFLFFFVSFEKIRKFAKPSKFLHFRLVYKVGPVLWNTLYVYFRPFLVIDIVHSIKKVWSWICWPLLCCVTECRIVTIRPPLRAAGR